VVFIIIVNIIFAVLSIVLYFFINNRGLADGPSPTVYNLILSLLFLALWLLFGIYRGRKRKTSFLIFSILFWAIGLGISLVAMKLGPNPLILVTLAFMAPINGFRFFEFMRSKLIIACMFLPIIITCIGYFLGRNKFNNSANLTNHLPEKSLDTLLKITKEEAISKAQNILAQLSMKVEELKQAEMLKDPVTAKEYWGIQFEGVSVDIDPESSHLIGIFVKNLFKGEFVITERIDAEKAARELYGKLQAPTDYKLIDLEKGYEGDYWSTVWAKEVIPGVYSKYESVNLRLASDTGKLYIYRLFNTPPKSLEVIVAKDQAVITARTIAEAKGFKTFSEAKLEIEQASDYWTSQGSPKIADYCTLVWVVTFKDSLQNRALVYVDTLTGLVVGGGQTM